jgi:hypothetical protein
MSSKMSRQPKLRPKSHIEGFPDGVYDFPTLASLSQHGHHMAMSEDKPDQRVFRVKRKHVLKACDRCRVKKTKVACSRFSFSTAGTDLYSVMESNHATAVRHITTHVYFGKGRPPKPKSTLAGMLLNLTHKEKSLELIRV